MDRAAASSGWRPSSHHGPAWTKVRLMDQPAHPPWTVRVPPRPPPRLILEHPPSQPHLTFGGSEPYRGLAIQRHSHAGSPDGLHTLGRYRLHCVYLPGLGGCKVHRPRPPRRLPTALRLPPGHRDFLQPLPPSAASGLSKLMPIFPTVSVRWRPPGGMRPL